MKAYLHKVQYYETDQMGVVHHSNYIRWFEEARVDYMEQMGKGYDVMEEEGFQCPVVSVSCDFKSMTKFPNSVYILAKVKEFNGITFIFSYKVTDAVTGEIRATGESRHCFLDGKGGIVSVKKTDKELFELFNAYVGSETAISVS
nr:acyl-CoA thioesterase [Parasporobacterium paucivorans]